MARIVLITTSAEDLGYPHQVFRDPESQRIYALRCPGAACGRLASVARGRIADHTDYGLIDPCSMSGVPVEDRATRRRPSRVITPSEGRH
ncbi:predicted protein [Streptomyces sp. C]|nr:predicted protein [Streptomyces sp. C]